MKGKYRREITKGKDGKWNARVIAKNGQVVATMTQGYERKSAAIKEFDRIWSVGELQALHNILELALVEKSQSLVDGIFKNALAALDKIQALIDRSEG